MNLENQYDLYKLDAGISLVRALSIFTCACNKPDTLFITEEWFAPREAKLRTLLSDPLTEEEAQSLRDAVMKRHTFDAVLEWLEHGRDKSWREFTTHKARDGAQLARLKEEEHRRQHQVRLEEIKAMARPECPTCNSKDGVIPIFYGLPQRPILPSEGLYELGGCVWKGGSPKWRCKTCGGKFREPQVTPDIAINLTEGFDTQLRLPSSPTMLAEINFPPEVVDALVGKTVKVTVLPEEPAQSRQLTKIDEYPCLIDEAGKIWNDYRPLRVLFTDDDGRTWRLPRFWLGGVPVVQPRPATGEETIVSEELNLPTEWDLWDINITSLTALRVAGQAVPVVVKTSPDGGVEVFWCDPEGAVWRLPHDWRRRRIKLPSSEVLAAQAVPPNVADEFAHQTVAVNYHTGSLCCLPEHYRFRDGRGGKWPVRIVDCQVVGFGNGQGE